MKALTLKQFTDSLDNYDENHYLYCDGQMEIVGDPDEEIFYHEYEGIRSPGFSHLADAEKHLFDQCKDHLRRGDIFEMQTANYSFNTFEIRLWDGSEGYDKALKRAEFRGTRLECIRFLNSMRSDHYHWIMSGYHCMFLSFDDNWKFFMYGNDPKWFIDLEALRRFLCTMYKDDSDKDGPHEKLLVVSCDTGNAVEMHFTNYCQLVACTTL